MQQLFSNDRLGPMVVSYIPNILQFFYNRRSKEQMVCFLMLWPINHHIIIHSHQIVPHQSSTKADSSQEDNGIKNMLIEFFKIPQLLQNGQVDITSNDGLGCQKQLVKFWMFDVEMQARLFLWRHLSMMMRQVLEKGFSSSHSDFICWIIFRQSSASFTDLTKQARFNFENDNALRTQGQFLWIWIRNRSSLFFSSLFQQLLLISLSGHFIGIQASQSECSSTSIVALYILFSILLYFFTTSNAKANNDFILKTNDKAQQSFSVISEISIALAGMS